MLTPPAGVFKKIYPPQGGVILQETGPNDWANFCNVGDATALAALINGQANLQLQFPAAPYIDAEESLGYYITNPAGPRMYGLAGSSTADGSPFTISPVGGFLDRKTNPNPFLDHNTNGPNGGPNIVLVTLEPGLTMLKWGN